MFANTNMFSWYLSQGSWLVAFFYHMLESKRLQVQSKSILYHIKHAICFASSTFVFVSTVFYWYHQCSIWLTRWTFNPNSKYSSSNSCDFQAFFFLSLSALMSFVLKAYNQYSYVEHLWVFLTETAGWCNWIERNSE